LPCKGFPRLIIFLGICSYFEQLRVVSKMKKYEQVFHRLPSFDHSSQLINRRSETTRVMLTDLNCGQECGSLAVWFAFVL